MENRVLPTEHVKDFIFKTSKDPKNIADVYGTRGSYVNRKKRRDYTDTMRAEFSFPPCLLRLLTPTLYLRDGAVYVYYDRLCERYITCSKCNTTCKLAVCFPVPYSERINQLMRGYVLKSR
jgi:hypothetical protein